MATCLFALAAAFAPAAARAQAQGQPLTLLGYHAEAPANWVSRQPSSSARLAQFVVPGADSASDAEVVVFYFGGMSGGNVEANLERWREQFTTPEGGPKYEQVIRDSTGAFPITIAEYEGTYRRGIGMGSADSVRAGQMLVAAIAETAKGTLFLQMFGPVETVKAERPRFVAFVNGLH